MISFNEWHKKKKGDMKGLILSCHITNTPLNYYDCKKYMKSQKIEITREYYEKICRKMGYKV